MPDNATRRLTDWGGMAPRPVWRWRLVQLAAAWINEYHSELVDLPWQVWRLAQVRFGLSLAETVEACRLASADRNGGW